MKTKQNALVRQTSENEFNVADSENIKSSKFRGQYQWNS